MDLLVRAVIFSLLFIFAWSAPLLAQTVQVDIKGIDNAKVRNNVQLYMQTLEAPRDAYQFADFQQQIAKKVQQAVQAFGYYQAKSTSQATDESGQSWLLQIELGDPVLVTSLQLALTGAGEHDDVLTNLLHELPLATGEALSHANYEGSKAKLQSLALARGYFDFSFTEHKIVVDAKNNSAEISLLANTGERYRFGKLHLPEQEKAEAMIRRLSPVNDGEYYLSDQLALLNQRLKQTQYFRHVLVRPLVNEAQDHRVPIEVIVSHKPRDNFDIGMGVSSDDGGPRFKAKWNRPWVNDRGHSMSAEVFSSRIEQHLSLNYKIPMQDSVKSYAQFQIGMQSLHNNDTDSEKLTLAAQRHWELPQSDWQRIAFIRYEQEKFRQDGDPFQTSNLLIPGVTYSRLRSHGGLDIDWGDKQMITIEAAAEKAGSELNMFRISAQTRWLRSFEQHRLLLRLEGGAIATKDFSVFPSSLRYFAGGDQSIRGFGYRTVAPRDEQNNLIGARYLAVASAEYSYPVSDSWRAAVFVDAGNASEKLQQQLAVGTGVGAIWQSPIGPIRLYLARGHSSYETSWRLHLSMGPAL